MKKKTPRIAHRSQASAKQTHRTRYGVSGLLLGIGIGLVLWLLLLLLAAVVLVGLEDPAPFVLPAAFVSAAVGAFAAGLLSAKLSGYVPLLCGLIASALLLLTVLVLSLVSPPQTAPYGIVRVGMISVILAFCVLGACAAKKRNEGRKYGVNARK